MSMLMSSVMCRCVAEQVAHHPPTCAWHYEDPNHIQIYGNAKAAVHLRPPSLNIDVSGQQTCVVHGPLGKQGDTVTTQEQYSMTLPSLMFTFFPKARLEFKGGFVDR